MIFLQSIVKNRDYDTISSNSLRPSTLHVHVQPLSPILLKGKIIQYFRRYFRLHRLWIFIYDINVGALSEPISIKFVLYFLNIFLLYCFIYFISIILVNCIVTLSKKFHKMLLHIFMFINDIGNVQLLLN